MSKRQFIVVLSTTEVEYFEATHEIKEALWLQRLRLGMLMGVYDTPLMGREDTVRGCLFNPSHLV